MPPLPHPQLIFERERPECVWLVHAVGVPLYYLDDRMLRKKLVIFHPPDTFTITGSDRVFKLVAREQVHRTFWMGVRETALASVSADDWIQDSSRNPFRPSN